jgi:hypothetical protein
MKELQGKVYSLAKQGYIDIIKDGYAIQSQPITRSFHLKNVPEGSHLRIRMERSVWKSLQPDKTLLKVVVMPYVIVWPYLAIEEISNILIKLTFNSRIWEKLIKLKVWKK